VTERIKNEALKRQALKEEPRFLSIILKDRELLMDAMSSGFKKGREGHFWHKEPNFLFSIIKSYYDKHNAMLTRTAMESIMDGMSKIGKKEITDEDRASARMYWDKVYHLDVEKEDYELLKNNINSRYVQWQAYQIVSQNLENLVRSTNNQIDLVKDIQESFIKIDNMDPDPYSLAMDLEEGITQSVEYIEERRENPESLPAVPTGLRAIDSIYHGFEFGTYTIISGMINGGKTTLMFNIGFNMAKAGYNVVYISLEKKAVQLYTRLLSLHALVDYNRIKVGGKGESGLDDENYYRLKEASEDLMERVKPNFDVIQAAQGTKLSKLLSEVEKIKNRKKIDVLIVDYLGVIGNETNHPGRPDLDDAYTSSRLQSYGRINNFVTISAVQLKTSSSKEIRNRSKKASEDSEADVSVHTEDLAGSKMIIADADNGLSAVLNNDSPPTKMFVFGTKARDDEAKRTMALDFDGKLGRVSDPVFEPGQVSGVDDILFNSDITEEQLLTEDSIYDGSFKFGGESETDDLFPGEESPGEESPGEESPGKNDEVPYVSPPAEKKNSGAKEVNMKKDENSFRRDNDTLDELFDF
jgi:replicative DNA helicase